MCFCVFSGMVGVVYVDIGVFVVVMGGGDILLVLEKGIIDVVEWCCLKFDFVFGF